MLTNWKQLEAALRSQLFPTVTVNQWKQCLLCKYNLQMVSPGDPLPQSFKGPSASADLKIILDAQSLS